jgi:acyl dehydratase
MTGLYLEDFRVGEVHTTDGRTVTEADIVNFCCLSGDFNEVHSNYDVARQTEFGTVIAHGPLIMAIAAGLVFASGINKGTGIAALGIDKCRFHAVVRPGDTIHVENVVVLARPTSKPGRGVVVLNRRVVNQCGELVQAMDVTALYKTRPVPLESEDISAPESA